MKLLMLLLLMTWPALAKAQFTFTTNNGSIIITGYAGTNAVVVIPDATNGYPVTSIGDYAFEYASFSRIIIPTNIFNIGDDAFYYCVNLTNAIVSGAVTNIGDGVFSYCSSLLAINVDSRNPVYASVSGVLYDLTQTALLEYPGGLRGSFTIPPTVSVIGDGAFSSSGLTSVSMPVSLTNIGAGAFEYCSNLTNAIIPPNVSTIGDEAFSGTSLTSETIPASVKSIGSSVFTLCTALTNIIVVSSNADFSSLDGVLFDKGQKTLFAYPEGIFGNYTIPNSVTTIENDAFYGTALSDVVIPGGVLDIGAFAFAYSENLTDITIQNGVINIGNSAFSNCGNMVNVSIAASVTNLGDFSFSECGSLESISIPSSVSSIGQDTFEGCSGLTNVTIANGITSIGYQAFANCYSLANIIIPASVTNIEDWAFAYNGLTNVYFTGNAPTADATIFSGDIGASVYYLSGTTGWNSPFAGLPAFEWIQFSYITNNGSITITGYTGSNGLMTIPGTINGLPVTAIQSGAFYGSDLTNVIIPNGVTNIGVNTFSFCTSLINITIPNGVTSIGDYTFGSDSSLSSITLPDTIASIGDQAFNSCISLTNLVIPNGVTYISDDAFGWCIGLTNMIIPASVTNFGGNIFANCTGLISVTFPTNLIKIPNNMLYMCSRLTKVIIPNSVTDIGYGGFDWCTSLTNITIPNSILNIEGFAFGSCGLVDITLPNSITNIDDYAFWGCGNLKGVFFYGNAPDVGDAFLNSRNVTVYYLQSATGWSASFGGVPTALWLPQVNTDTGSFGVQTNQFNFTINWASGQTVEVDACTNLVDPQWQPVQTVALTNGSFNFSDAQWTNFPTRFYRLSSP